MRRDYFIKYLLLAQSGYTLLTALWGLLDIDSFMAVTGPKTDIWLVKAVSVLFVSIALSLIVSFVFNPSDKSSATLAITVSIGIAIIDFYYSLNHIIRPVYIVDGCIQLIFFCCWIRILIAKK
jgi:hypothetical protein